MNLAELSLDGWQLQALSLTAKVSTVLLLAMFVSYLMRRRPSAERHLVWVVAVVAVLVLPLSATFLPAVRVSVSAPSWLRDVVRPPTPAIVPLPSVSAEPVVAPTPMPAPMPATAMPGLPATMVAPAPRASLRPSPAIAPATTPLPPPSRPSRGSVSGLLFVIWLGGAVVALGAVLVGVARVHIYARRARPLTDPALLVRAHGIAAELGVRRQIRLLEGRADAMPMTFGVLRSTVLLPAVARQWSAARQQTVLRHELAHIRRRDALSQLAAEFACALNWFNPLVWYAAHRLHVEREHACDDLVLISGSRAADYAAELVEIARSMRVQRAAPLAALAMARPSHLRLRIMALLEDRNRRAALSTRLLVPAWLGAFAIVLPLSAIAPRLRWPTVAREQVSTPLPKRTPHTAGRFAPVAPPARDVTAPAAGVTQVHAFSHSGSVPPVTAMSSAAAPSAAATSSPVVLAVPASLARAGAAQATDPLRALAARLRAIGRSPQEDCLTRSGNRSTSHNDNDERTTIKWSGTGCSGEVIIEGDITFDESYTRITGLSRGGMIRIITAEGRSERRLTIRPDNNALTYEYSVDGRRAEFDAAGQRWLDATLLFLFRSMGLLADERATAILNRGGPNAVLTEVGLLNGDYVRARYLGVLVEKGRLDEATLRRVLELAGNTLASDHYRTEVITRAAGRYEFTDGVRQAYINAASRMSSDHYKHTAFVSVLDKGNLTPPQLAAVLNAAGTISSDHYRAELLRSTAGRYGLAPEMRSAYLNAATGIKSDHYKTVVLDGVLRRDLASAELARVVEATTSVASDHYRAQLLTKVGALDLRDPALQASFVRAASGIKSPHYKQQVLSTAAARSDLDRGALLAVIDAAATIDSDHYLAAVLTEIARRHTLDGDARERFMRAMDSIKSTHYRGQVADALLRQSR